MDIKRGTTVRTWDGEVVVIDEVCDKKGRTVYVGKNNRVYEASDIREVVK